MDREMLLTCLAKVVSKKDSKKSDVKYEKKLDPKVLSLIPETDALKRYILDSKKTFGGYTAYVENKPVGFCSLHSTVIEVGTLYGGESDRAVIVQMIVSSDFRGKGIGENLLQKTLDLAYDLGFDIYLGYTNHSPGFKKLSKKYKVKDVDDADWNEIYS
jgi:GNAT superfamily N-acetyltransferase